MIMENTYLVIELGSTRIKAVAVDEAIYPGFFWRLHLAQLL